MKKAEVSALPSECKTDLIYEIRTENRADFLFLLI